MLWSSTLGYLRRRRLYVRNKGGQPEDRVAKFMFLEEVRQSSHWDESLADDQPLCLRGEMGVCVCCLVVGASHSQERRKLAAADCEVLDCFSQPARYNSSRTYTTTGNPPRRTQADYSQEGVFTCRPSLEPACPTSSPRPGSPEWLHDATAANWSPRSGNPSWWLEAEGLAVLQS